MTNPVALIRHVDDHGDHYDSITIWCPGCERSDADGHKRGGLHMLPVTGDGSKRPTWEWNGEMERVTLTPSIKVTGVQWPRDSGFYKPQHVKVASGAETVCHSYVIRGEWQYLADSTHPLAGQTVPMAPLPDWVIR